MNALIVSDLHIGSRYFLYQAFDRFLRNIPKDYELIMNGDIIDKPYEELNHQNQRLMDRIKELSYSQNVVWVKGNHDDGYIPEDFGKINVKNLYAIENRLLIAHGNDFDEIMPQNSTFMKAFKLMHIIRVKLGAKPVHVAKYAKKWGVFYRVLLKNVIMNAVDCAAKNGYEAVTCGHTHYVEDRVLNGIRYINTGSWTESPIFFLHITAEEMTLKKDQILRASEKNCVQ